jgi:thiol-disulfide isomerase/thioredoxin
MQSLQRFLSIETLPWRSVLGDDPSKRGWNNPMVAKCGITSIPFLVLVGQDGNVLATNVRGDALDEKLAELFPGGDDKPAPTEDAKPAPAGETDPAEPEKSTSLPADPAAPKTPAPELNAPKTSAPDPAAPKTSAPEPAATEAGDDAKSSSLPRGDRRSHRENGFVGLAAPVVLPADPPQPSSSVATAKSDVDAADAEDDGEESEVNPYSPPSGLSARQLVDFIFSMQEKPVSIQRRPGFAAAVVEAADQVLAAKVSDQLQIVAAEAKFEVLHQAASLGDEQADKQLDEFVHQLRDDARKRIAKQVQFFRLERKALDADDLPLGSVPELLDELQTYFDGQKLSGKHLRIASATVHAINRMTDGAVREEYFKTFGNQFATSKDKDLARYGRKIGKAPAQPVAALVGKPLELDGITALGTTFDWAAYRGKIVVVDFWATWCGPCRRETPHLQALAKTSNKLAVVAVSLDRDLEAVEKYLAEHEIEWANLVGEDATQIAGKYGIRAIPTMLVVDAEGNVVAVGNKVSQIQAKVQQLLAG